MVANDAITLAHAARPVSRRPRLVVRGMARYLVAWSEGSSETRGE